MEEGIDMNISEVLQGALALNGEDKKYVITVEGNQIITKVKWMDAVFFTPGSVTDQVKEFQFIAKLNENGTWVEIDKTKSVTKSIGTGGISVSQNGFKGKQIGGSKTIAIGRKRDGDAVGVVKVSFNSEEYKKPVSDYLERCGYKKTKMGFFASLFGK